MPTAADRKLLPHGFRALRVPSYRRYWLGQLASQTGSWMQITAQGWLVLTLTQSPLAIGLVTTLQFMPVMLLSLIGGTLSDWLPRHRLIFVTQWAALAQALVFGLLVTSGHVRLWHVYVLAALQGVIQAIDTPARQSGTAPPRPLSKGPMSGLHACAPPRAATPGTFRAIPHGAPARQGGWPWEEPECGIRFHSSRWRRGPSRAWPRWRCRA